MLPVVHVAFPGTHVVIAVHAVLTLVAVAVGVFVAGRCARSPAVVTGAAPFVVAAAMLGARVLFRAMHGGSPFAWTGGLSSMGGIVAGLLTIVVAARLTRTSVTELLDAYAPAAILALGIGRIGCFLGGCCAGRPTSVWWAVVFPDLDPMPRHPLQLYAAGVDFALVAWLLRSGGPPGTIARRACVGLGIARFCLETLRDPGAVDLVAGGWLTLGQLGAALLVVLGAVMRPSRPHSLLHSRYRGRAAVRPSEADPAR